jgi:hypothetical protein
MPSTWYLAVLTSGTLALSPAAPGWTVTPSPDRPGGDSVLAGVTATSATDEWAVGSAGGRPFIVHRGTGAWRSVSAPRVAGRLAAVDAVSRRNVWAVGATAGPAPLAAHFDGTAWRTVPTPAVGGAAQLVAVSARTASDVWAVGQRQADVGPATLIEHFDGRRWSVVPGPTVNEIGGSRLTGVAAVAADDAWAVGTRGDELLRPYVLHWDGRTWRAVTVPLPPQGAELLDLRAVTARSASDVWAVGSDHLVEHFDGHRWTVVPAPDAGTDPDDTTAFTAVAARSARDAWTVGIVTSAAGPRTVTEHWDGTAWRIVPSPNPSPGLNFLTGVAVPAGGAAVAVGYRQAGTTLHTLVLDQK